MGYVLSNKGGSGTLGQGTTKTCVYHDGSNVFAGSNVYVAAGVFNDTTFVAAKQALTTSGTVTEINGDGSYVYALDNAGYLRASQIVDGTVTQIGSAFATGYPTSNVNFMECDSQGFVHVGGGSEIGAFSFDGTNFVKHTATAANLGSVRGIHFDGSRLFYGTAQAFSQFNCYIYSDSSYTRDTTLGFPAGYCTAVTSDSSYVYFAGLNGSINFINAYTLSSHTFTQAATITTSVTSDCLVSDGYYVYSYEGSSSNRIAAYHVSDGSFNLKGSISIASGMSPNYQVMFYRSPYLYYCLGPAIVASSFNLKAQFTADKLTGIVPLTINFAAT